VAGELPREPHNAPLHLFSAAPKLVEFGSSAYQRRSERTSKLLGLLCRRLQGEGFAMSYTMEDFDRDYNRERFLKLTPEKREELLRSLPTEERQELVRSLPPEERLAGLTAEQIQQYLARLSPKRPATARRPRRKK
jgi:hypothetical protein